MTIQKPDKFELFEDFANGRLGKKDAKLFAYWIEKDPLFAEKMEQYKQLFSGLKTLRILEIEKQLKEQIETLEEEGALPDENIEELEQIERYFQNQLRGQELKDFEYRKTTDPAFAEKVAQYETIFGGMRQLRLEELEKTVREASATMEEESSIESVDKENKTSSDPKLINVEPLPPKKGVLRRLIPLITAAAAALLLYFSMPFFQTSDADFYANLQQTYQEMPTVDNLMSANPTEGKYMEAGLQAFKAKKYALARVAFKNVTGNEEATLLLGHSYFGEGSHTAATKVYQSMQTAGNPDYRNEADWFLAQCYLKNLPEQKNELTTILKKISETKGTHNYKRKASKLLDELGSR